MPPPSRLDTLNDLPISAFRAKYWPHNDSCFKIFGPGDQESWRFQLRTSDGLTQGELMNCFCLIRDTSAADYKASPDGWHPIKKRREMRLLDMRFILLGRCSLACPEAELCSPIEGFLSFMLTWEDGVEVIYCYEIHLEEHVRGRGMGKRLMGQLEEVGRRAEVKKAMLTVFKKNKAAVEFYERLGYKEDEYSPRPKKLRNGVIKELDYLIMSKSLISGVKNHEEERQRKRKAAG